MLFSIFNIFLISIEIAPITKIKTTKANKPIPGPLAIFSILPSGRYSSTLTKANGVKVTIEVTRAKGNNKNLYILLKLNSIFG